MIKTIEDSEELEESSEGGNDRKRIRFDPNVSQIKTNFIPGIAFRHKSQLSSKTDVCVRKRNHSLASSQPSVDEDYDSDATVIDETFAETVDDWRNGPAKYWYDRLGLPPDCLEYDYGLKVMDNRESSHTSRPSVDSEDAFNLVSQTEWESEVIWDSDVVAQQVMKRAKELETSAGWLPIGSTRSAPDFVKQIECPIVGGVADDIEDNCGKSVFNANNDIDRPLLKRSKMLRSGVPHDVLFCSNTRIKVNENLSEDANQMAKDLSKYTINTISELTARNGEVVVMEYSEEEPPFLMRVGMGSKIMNYFKTTKEKNSLPLEEYSELRIVSTDSPFIGEIDSGKSQLALENNMFRSHIFRHSCPETVHNLLTAIVIVLCIGSVTSNLTRNESALITQQIGDQSVVYIWIAMGIVATIVALIGIALCVFFNSNDTKPEPTILWLSKADFRQFIIGYKDTKNAENAIKTAFKTLKPSDGESGKWVLKNHCVDAYKRSFGKETNAAGGAIDDYFMYEISSGVTTSDIADNQSTVPTLTTASDTSIRSLTDLKQNLPKK